MVGNMACRCALGIAVGIMTLALLAGGAGALSNDGGGSWQYYRDITISNPGGALSEYQVLVNLSGSSFPEGAQAGGADIRFEDASGAELSYWIEHWDYANRSTLIWVNVTGIPLGASTIRMYYGNPSASPSLNGMNTFDFFDDFSGTSLDTSRWSPNYTGTGGSGSSIAVGNGELKLTRDGSLNSYAYTQSIYAVSTDMIVETRAKSDIAGANSHSFIYNGLFQYLSGNPNDNEYARPLIFIRTYSDTTRSYELLSALNTSETLPYPIGQTNLGNDGWTRDIYNIFKIERIGNTSVKFYVNDSLLGIHSTYIPTESLHLYLKIGNQGYAYESIDRSMWYDWVRVRKYASPEPSVSVGAQTPVTNNVCAALCHNYEKDLPRSIDFYPDTAASFDRYTTFLGILNQMRDTPMNVTDPAIDFYYDPADLNGSSYDYFRKVRPFSQQTGNAFFKFENIILSNGNGTYGVDEGVRHATTGFDVSRKVENNGLITKDGYLNVTVSGILYENVNNYIALSAGLWNTSEFNVWVVNWTTSEPVDYSDIRSDNVFVHFRTESEILPRKYDLNVTFYVDKIIPANITLKPWAAVNTRHNLQHIENTRGDNISLNGTMFDMNTTFSSSNDNLTWVADEAFEKRINMDGGIADILSPYAEFSLNKNFVVETDSDSLSGGSYERNLRYRLDINNREDASHTVLGNLNFSARADNITYVGQRQYAAWNETSIDWVFPHDILIRENERFGTGFDTNYSESRYLEVDVSRWMNRTEFSTDGYQLAKFNVTFKDMNFKWAWARIEAYDRYPGYGVDASIVPGTFITDAPGHFSEDEKAVHFDFDKERLHTDVTYNFSVIIRVNLTGERELPIYFKPELAVGEGLYNDYSYETGYTVEVPSSMLPDNIDHVSASTNTSNAWLINRADNVIAVLINDIGPPDVTNAAANQSDIPDDTDYVPMWGETAQLNVTVIDDNGIASVTINLSEIGGEADKPMINVEGNIYSTTTNASAGTSPKLYNLTVNATDIFGNSNTSVRIQLRVMKNGDTTGNGVVNIGDALRLANNVSYPGDPRYPLSSIYVADVTGGDGKINIGDALRLANNVSYPGDPRYILK